MPVSLDCPVDNGEPLRTGAEKALGSSFCLCVPECMLLPKDTGTIKIQPVLS